MSDGNGGPGDNPPDGRDAGDPDAEDPLAWETVASEVAYACPGFDVVREEVVLPDGTATDYDYLSEPPAVVVAPFTGTLDPGGPADDSEVVVIEEWRQAVDRVNRGLPAGGMEPGDDDPTAAARRELAEETGYEADRLRRLTALEPANGIADSVHHHFVAEGCTPTASQALDHDESIRVDATTFGALREGVADGTVRDGRTALAVLFLDRFGPPVGERG